MEYQRLYEGKRVLVTGGLGFIGSNLALVLHGLGAHVSVIDALIPAHGGDLYNLAPISSEVPIVVGDVGNPSELLPLIEDQDYIFHLAGQMSHGDSMRNPELDLQVNCVATMRLLEACRIHNPGAVLVNTSTRQVYGRPRSLPVTEDHVVDPIDVNGINKAAAEHYHLLYYRVHGLRSVVLRLTNTYGPRQQISNDRQGVAGIFIHRALCKLPLMLYGGGNQLRDFNYVDDVVDALLVAAATPECHGQVFNLGADAVHSLKDYTEILCKLCGTRSEVIPFPPEKKHIDIGDYYGSYEKFHAVTQWKPRVQLDEGLRRSVEFFRAHSERYLK